MVVGRRAGHGGWVGVWGKVWVWFWVWASFFLAVLGLLLSRRALGISFSFQQTRNIFESANRVIFQEEGGIGTAGQDCCLLAGHHGLLIPDWSIAASHGSVALSSQSEPSVHI